MLCTLSVTSSSHYLHLFNLEPPQHFAASSTTPHQCSRRRAAFCNLKTCSSYISKGIVKPDSSYLIAGIGMKFHTGIPEFSHFQKQPCNRLYSHPKKLHPECMSMHCCNDATLFKRCKKSTIYRSYSLKISRVKIFVE